MPKRKAAHAPAEPVSKAARAAALPIFSQFDGKALCIFKQAYAREHRDDASVAAMVNGGGTPAKPVSVPAAPVTPKTVAPEPALVDQTFGPYTLKQRIGKGHHGPVHLGTDAGGLPIAVKLERESIFDSKKQLAHEHALLLKCMATDGQAVVTPAVFWLGSGHGFTAMAMELLGPSLDKLQSACGGTFTLKTVVMAADQLLGCFERLHKLGITQRSVKPENMAVRLASPETLVLIDLGGGSQCRQFVAKARPSYTGVSFKGRCASIGSADGYETSQRDDVEALGYALVEMLGMLPWTEGQDANAMKERKRSGVQDQRIPDAIRALISYTRGLCFGEAPAYALWRSIFKQLFVDQNYGETEGLWSHGQFDWLTAAGKFKRGVISPDLVSYVL